MLLVLTLLQKQDKVLLYEDNIWVKCDKYLLKNFKKYCICKAIFIKFVFNNALHINEKRTLH